MEPGFNKVISLPLSRTFSSQRGCSSASSMGCHWVAEIHFLTEAVFSGPLVLQHGAGHFLKQKTKKPPKKPTKKQNNKKTTKKGAGRSHTAPVLSNKFGNTAFNTVETETSLQNVSEAGCFLESANLPFLSLLTMCLSRPP